MPIIEQQTGEKDMSKIIKTKRVVVAPNGDEFENETAFKRHAFQAAAGKARTRDSDQARGYAASSLARPGRRRLMMPYVREITGYREGQPIYRDVEHCDWCGSYGHAIKTEGSKTTIGCIWKDGEPGCKENER